MYAKVSEGKIKIYPYTISQLRKDNPLTSFPAVPDDEMLADWGVVPVVETSMPIVDDISERVKEGSPQYVAGKWVQVWVVETLSADEIARNKEGHNRAVKDARAECYRSETDPIFFKLQRGEASMEEWLAAIERIKFRYPYKE